MTWILDQAPDHAGDLVGLLPCTDVRGRRDGYRELDTADQETIFLQWIAVACSCGWRSPRLEAPIDASWRSGSVETSEWFARDCYGIWRAHAIATVCAETEKLARG